jgi:hypothetical protein
VAIVVKPWVKAFGFDKSLLKRIWNIPFRYVHRYTTLFDCERYMIRDSYYYLIIIIKILQGGTGVVINVISWVRCLFTHSIKYDLKH